MNQHPAELSTYRNLALANTGVSVTTGPTNVVGWSLSNSAGTIRYVKIYNKATAATAADTPVFTIGIPTLQTVSFYPSGSIRLPLGMSLRCTTEPTDAGTTGATSGDVLAHILFKNGTVV